MLSIRQKHIFSGHKSSIYGLTARNDGKLFYSSGGDGYLVEWHFEKPDQGKLIAQVPSTVFTIEYIEFINCLAVGSMQGILYLVQIQNKETKTKSIPKSIQFKAGVFATFHSGEYLYVADGSGFFSKVDLLKFEVLDAWKLSESSLRSIDLAANSNLLAVGSSDGNVYLFDIELEILRSTLVFHLNSVFTAVFNSYGTKLFSGSRDAHLAMWDQENSQEIDKPSNFYKRVNAVPAHMFTINSLAIQPEIGGNLIASASRDKTIKFWNNSNLELIKVIDLLKGDGLGHKNSVNKLIWLNEKTLISASDDRQIIAWEVILF